MLWKSKYQSYRGLQPDSKNALKTNSVNKPNCKQQYKKSDTVNMWTGKLVNAGWSKKSADPENLIE